MLPLASWGLQGLAAGRSGNPGHTCHGSNLRAEPGPSPASRTLPRHVSPLLTSSLLRARAVTREGAGLGEREGAPAAGGVRRKQAPARDSALNRCPRLTLLARS